MPSGRPLDRDYVAALRLLDAVDLPYAEVWRKLGLISGTLNKPRPGYSCVRRFLIEERRRKIARMALANAMLDETMLGMAPWSLFRALR
ncbi:MAG: hypothetical protein M3377_01575 [Actinomycetota bacterium]|nr:hypothetical protein [Actinomycetota bacterium]